MTNTSGKSSKETRKLQMTGGSTYILSLPKKWVSRNQLTKGSSLLIREEGNGSVTILPPELEKPEKSDEAFIEVSPKDNPDALTRKTVSAYLIGCNLVHLRAKDQQEMSSRQRNNLKVFARQLLVGTEIVTDTPKELTLQVLLNYPELSVPSALRRMSIITFSMHKDAVTALKKLDHRLAKDVISTDNEVDRFHLYIVRQLKMAIQNPRIIKEIGLENPRDCLGYRLMTKTVERTADHAANIAKNVLILKRHVDEKALEKIDEMGDIAISSFETAVDALFKRDFDTAERVIEETERVASLEKEAVLSSRETDINEVTSLRLIIESVRRTAEYASDIAEIVLNLTVESTIG